MYGLGGGDLVFGDRVVARLDNHSGPVARKPAHAAQDVLARQKIALDQPSVDDSGEGASKLTRNRRGARLVENSLEVGALQLPTTDIADDRHHVLCAVPLLLLAHALRPLLHPCRAPHGIEEVSDELS